MLNAVTICPVGWLYQRNATKLTPCAASTR